MIAHGPAFKAYVDGQRMNKSKLAKDLNMTKQNLYQLFQSKEFKEDTIKKIEKELDIKWKAVEDAWEVNTVNIDQSNSQSDILIHNKDGKVIGIAEVKSGSTDYKDKYINALERLVEKQEALLVDVRASLSDVTGRLTEAEKLLSEVRVNQQIMYSVQQGFQKYWTDYLGQTDSSQEGAQKKIASIAASELKKIRKEGIAL